VIRRVSAALAVIATGWAIAVQLSGGFAVRTTRTISV